MSSSETRYSLPVRVAVALVTAYQIHSATALTTDGAWPGALPQGDAGVTARPGRAPASR